MKQDTIVISGKWMQELDDMPFVIKQKGRMSMLLKQKTKVNAVPKERVIYDAFDFQKRARDAELRVQQEIIARQAEKQAKADGKKPKLVKPTVLEKYDEEMKKEGQ